MNLAGDIYTVDLCIWSDKSTYSVYSPIERELASFPSVLKNMLSKFSFHFNMLTVNGMGETENLRAFLFTFFFAVERLQKITDFY